jgi:hypothetical protein
MKREKWRLNIIFILTGFFTILISALIARPNAELPLHGISPQPTLTTPVGATAQPTRTPTQISTPLPTATRTPLLPTATPFPLFLSRPILLPVATPPTGPEHYRLRNWSAEDVWSLVFTLEAYAQDLGEVSLPPITRLGVSASEQAIRLVLLDAVLRFPQSNSLEGFEWRLAMAAALGVYETPQDAQIVRLLETGVQEGRYDLNDLDVSLLPFGFHVSRTFTAENLFGDGLQNQVLVIGLADTSASLEGGIVLAVREDQAGMVEFIRITSDWPEVTLSGGFTDMVLTDFTGDSQPELLVGTYRHSGTMYGEEIKIFQWREDQFVDLTPGGKGIYIDGFFSEWYWQPPDDDGKIVFRTMEYAYQTYREYNTYLWDGSSFEWSGVTVDLSGAHAYWDSYFDNIQLDAETRIDYIEDVLAAWAGEEVNQLGESYPDYLRFEEAMLYLSLFDESHAGEILQAIVDDPYNQDNGTVLQAAQAFLDNYHQPGDVYRACRAANRVMTRTLGGSGNTSQGDYPDLRSLWGYSTSGDLCDEEDAVYILIDYWNSQPTTSTDIVTLLEQAGVRILGRSSLDLTGDHLDDAMAMMQISSADGSQLFWLAGFVRSASGIIPVTLNLSQLSNSSDLQNPGEYYISFYQPGGNTPPILILLVEGRLHILSIEIANKQAAVTTLYTLHRVTNYQIFRYPDAFEIQVVLNPQQIFDLLGETLRWESATQEFEVTAWQVTNPLGIPLHLVAYRAETLLLKANNPQAAIPLLEVLAFEPLPDDYHLYSRSESLYYLAWAYELTGDDISAAQAYWQLWQSYPDSVYALIAYARLEFEP